MAGRIGFEYLKLELLAMKHTKEVHFKNVQIETGMLKNILKRG
jgi:hypothetical protein